MEPPKVNLQPGMTGNEVKQLQQWLISQGFNISAGATGYFGDQTKAALTQYQQAKGIDTKGNPGYYGPITRNYILNSGNQGLNVQPIPGRVPGEQGYTITQPGQTPTQPPPAWTAPGYVPSPVAPGITYPFVQPPSPQLDITPVPGRVEGEQGYRIQEPMPNYDPAGRNGTISPGGQWIYQNDQWIPNNQQQSTVPSQAPISTPPQPQVQPNPTPPDETTPPVDTLEGMYLQLPSELQTMLSDLSGYIKTLTDQGKQFNPNIVLDQATMDRFLTQAKSEYAPFYETEKRIGIDTLQQSLQELVRQSANTQEDLQRQYQTGFRQIGEQAAERGAVFSGARLGQENELTTGLSTTLQRNREALQYGAGQATTEAERLLGSQAVQGIQMPTFGGQPVGRTIGGLFGTLPAQQQTAELTRQSQLEDAERRKRILDLLGQ